MAFPTRFGATAPASQPGQNRPPVSQQQEKTQQQKEDEARKQAQLDPHNQRTPQ